MAIGPSILEQENDLKGLPTEALQQMMRQPSAQAPLFLVAAELKRREEMAKEFAGREAATKTAQQAPTVAHRLAGRQQPIPMSQAGAMAAPPQQPPMPREAQLAMALSGATGRPAPQLPTVNMQEGSSRAAIGEIVKALRAEDKRSGLPFSARKRAGPVIPPALAAVIASFIRQQNEQNEPERAYRGFDISPEDSRLPGGRGRMVAAARPAAMAANGTQGRTVYAQEGYAQEGRREESLDEWQRRTQKGPGLMSLIGGLLPGDNVPANGGVVGVDPPVPDTSGQTTLQYAQRASWEAAAQKKRAQQLADESRATALKESLALQAAQTRRSVEKRRVGEEGAEEQEDVGRRFDEIIASFFGDIQGPVALARSIGGYVSQPMVERKAEIDLLNKVLELRPALESNPELFAQFEKDPRGFMYNLSTQGLPGLRSQRPPPGDVPGRVPLPIPVGMDPDFITGRPPTGEQKVIETVTETDKPLADWPTNFSPTVTADKALVGGGDEGSFQRISAALRGRLTALEKEELPDVTGQANEFFKTLTDANKQIFTDLETGLKEFRTADAKDFEKLETRFQALDDFYETGKLPERMRRDRLTNLMLEMSKGLLGSPDLYSGFKDGLEGFQIVDKAARDEYAKGLAARLTASKGIIDSKMAMRNARRQESIAMTEFAVQQNRGNADLAMEQLKIAQQAKQDARTHQLNLIRGETGLLTADASMAAAMKPGETTRLLTLLPERMYPGALAKAKAGDRTELDKFFYRDSQGKVHPNMPAFISEVNRLKSTGYGAAQTANAQAFDRLKIAFQKDVTASVGALGGSWTRGNSLEWAAIAKSIGVTPPTGATDFDKVRAQLVPAAKRYYAAQMARERRYVTPGMPEWIAQAYGTAGAGQSGNPLNLPKPQPE